MPWELTIVDCGDSPPVSWDDVDEARLPAFGTIAEVRRWIENFNFGTYASSNFKKCFLVLNPLQPPALRLQGIDRSELSPPFGHAAFDS